MKVLVLVLVLDEVYLTPALAMRGRPVIRGHFLRTVSYLPHAKDPVTNGHLSCSDTFSKILRCPLITGFTV